jgi:hypothetical protein
MRPVVFPVVVIWGLASAGFATALAVGAPEPQLAGRLYAATTAGAILTLLVAKLGAAARSGSGPRFEELITPATPGETNMPPELAFMEQSIRFATSSAADLHTRLRPVVREVAAHRLAARSIGLDNPAHQEAIEAMLGPVTYELVRKDRPRPVERFAPGATPASIREVIAKLEELGD